MLGKVNVSGGCIFGILPVRSKVSLVVISGEKVKIKIVSSFGKYMRLLTVRQIQRNN